MRRTAAAVVLLLALGAGGCASTETFGVEPRDRQAASAEPSDLLEKPAETETPEPEVASFKDRYTYEDGVEVEVTRVQHGKVSANDAEIDTGLKQGQDWVALTVRVRNGSSKRLDVSLAAGTLYYGPDGEEAQTPYLSKYSSQRRLSGRLLPKKAKSGTILFLVPKKHQDDADLEFTFDFQHESARFSGSVAR